MSYTPRMVIPEKGNPYYNRKQSGGYSSAILGSPTEDGLDVLRNCVGYANSRFAEIQGLNKIQYQLVCNAENFIDKAQIYGLTIGTEPKLGSIIVWQGGATKRGQDGAGHVAIVEQINPDGSIVTSESGYQAKKAFWTQTRNNSNGRWGQNSSYTFLGFIYNPAVDDDEPPRPIIRYAVQKRDTLTKIAKKFNTTVEALVKANNIANPNLIYVGQVLTIV